MLTALVSLLAGLIGISSGAWLSYKFGDRAEQTRWQRAHLFRWDVNRLAVYSEYVEALKTEVRCCLTVASCLNLIERKVYTPIGEAQRALEDIANRRAACFDKLLLLADPSTVEAARAWQNSVRKLSDSLSLDPMSSRIEFNVLVEATGDNRDLFQNAARASLGNEAVPAPDRTSRKW